jgi:hypothetical protein
MTIKRAIVCRPHRTILTCFCETEQQEPCHALLILTQFFADNQHLTMLFFWVVTPCRQSSGGRWRQFVSPKRYLHTSLHGVTPQNNIVILTAVRTSNVTTMTCLIYLFICTDWSSGMYCRVNCLSTIILHGSTSQKTILNIILAAARTCNLTYLFMV